MNTNKNNNENAKNVIILFMDNSPVRYYKFGPHVFNLMDSLGIPVRCIFRCISFKNLEETLENYSKDGIIDEQSNIFLFLDGFPLSDLGDVWDRLIREDKISMVVFHSLNSVIATKQYQIFALRGISQTKLFKFPYSGKQWNELFGVSEQQENITSHLIFDQTD